jgi:DNA-directed RNA polymerase subunit alpha
MGLALKDSPPGFDPSLALAEAYGSEDDDLGYAETEQY